ncbi:DNA-methyltransferase [Burkholderia cepacia]|uniref:Methyltransferase n=1 Tax=Burkholderia cepacia GG4 TaxID=1009846 RepID=A0A9W3K6F7_BURCE|nr:site-specific DNA-methyltransferase [Burkholderia cepacia]AFQ49462.1 putative DNA methylase N-4/N-6 [Burkholderia cepacia GG4]
MRTKSEPIAFGSISPAETHRYHADARHIPIGDSSVDLIVTSPPYWKKRDYGFAGQIGQEPTPSEYVINMIECMREWRRVLKRTGSIFINVGDSYNARTLAGVPARLEAAAIDDGWIVRNRIIWTKESGMPEPAKNRLANRHEYIIHFVRSPKYFYDLVGYSEAIGNGANPGDVWNIPLKRNMGDHLAPFPDEIVRRAVLLACPRASCPVCGHIPERVFERTAQLDTNRPQAKRAMEIAKAAGLTKSHIAAIQATGISDAGKALKVQTGTGRNSAEVQRLASEAKAALGGYFREFTFAKKATVGWTTCNCSVPLSPGVVLDPFMGTGTALTVANEMGRSAIGVDLAPKTDDHVWGQSIAIPDDVEPLEPLATKRKRSTRSAGLALQD